MAVSKKFNEKLWHRLFVAITFLCIPWQINAQNTDWEWWNTLHGWESGMPNWRMWLTISPGYLGPNALPVPDMKNGLIKSEGEAKISTGLHLKEGDNTQNISGYFMIPFAKSKIAFEVYGVIIEKYQMSEQVRDERVARDKDGKGITPGDIYFSTLIQLSRNRKFPNTLLRLATKTASGGAYYAARYSDSPGYFFDISFSKDLNTPKMATLRPFASMGFYSWQTNDEENLQNDAFMFGAGLEFLKNDWTATSTVSGYAGYKNEKDQPLAFTFGLKKHIGRKSIQFQYIHGIKDWEYDTFMMAYSWHFKGIN